MYILSGNGDCILRVDSIQKLCIAEKPDACLILASYNPDMRPTTLGRYADKKDAMCVMSNIFSALEEGKPSYTMPPNTLHLMQDKPQAYHGKKPQRRGGS